MHGAKVKILEVRIIGNINLGKVITIQIDGF